MASLRMLFARRVPAIFHRAPIRQWRHYSTPKSEYQAPTPAQNPHRVYYQSWGMPFIKVFLGALLTYQVIYMSWLKLEEMETKHTKEEETKILEGRLAELTSSKPSASKT